MENRTISNTSAIPHVDDSHGGTKLIIRVTVILTVLTIVELAFGFWMMGMPLESFSRRIIKGIIVILMIAKAFYIVGYFMHLKQELTNLIMTIIVPLGLFIWFIVAFLADGNSFKNNRNTYNSYYKESSTRKAPKEGQEIKEPAAKEPAAPRENTDTRK